VKKEKNIYTAKRPKKKMKYRVSLIVDANFGLKNNWNANSWRTNGVERKKGF